MNGLKHDWEIISHLRTEDKEYRTCFACHQLLPVKRMEQHHFPTPRRYDGVDTIWLCLACHDFVDRITIGKWPEHFMANAMNVNREHKLLMLKLWSVYTDLKFGGTVTKEASRVGEKIAGEQPSLNNYGIPECKQCGDEMECPEEGGDWYCVTCEIDESDFKQKPSDLSLSHTQLWMLATIWLSMPTKQRINFCIEYQVNDIIEREMDAKARAIISISQK